MKCCRARGGQWKRDDEATKQHMFERGFSTKASESRGIGLYLIQKIVNKCGAHLEVESELGAGTSFILSFPMNTRKEDADV